MNEGKTTGIFGIIAAVTLGLAWLTKPASLMDQKDLIIDLVGQDVFSSFQDPESATSLQIIKYDEELAQLKRFEVARDPVSKVWTLPSNDGYPADASEQVRDATTPLIGMKILSVESDLRGDHELYGVVNPDDDIAAGASGVGMLVTLKDDTDAILASVVIGKEVEQAEGQRYVRKPSEDAVYKVELTTDAFTTEFRDWIEGELLGVRSFDITHVGVRDYELIRQGLTSMALKRNFDAEVDYESSSSSWSLASMQTYESGVATPASMAAGEELNSEYLNTLRTSVQDLEIVDVKRKPQGLAADLKADESLMNDTKSIQSLQSQGFYPAGGQDGAEIFAAAGETIIGKDNGVSYVLRFGEVTASLTSGSLGDDGDDEDSGISRYLLVTAKLDESKFPQPDLEPIPETVEEMLALENPPEETIESLELPPAPEMELNSSGATEPSDSGESDSAPAETGTPDSSETSEAGEAPPAGEATESPASEGAEEGTTTTETPPKPPAGEDPAAETSGTGTSGAGNTSEQPDADPEALPQEQEAESGATEEAADTSAAASEPQTGEAGSDDSPEETQEELEERLEALQEKITKENTRKLDERNEKIAEARKEVQALNARFSDWYYVVSDSVYKKIKVTREDLIKKAEADTAAPKDFGADLPNFGGVNNPLNPQP